MIIEKDIIPRNPQDKISPKDFYVPHDNIISSAFHRGPSKRSGYKLTGFLLASVAADILVILACTCLFLMGAMFFLKLSNKNLIQTGFYLYGYISIIYFVLLRVFLGATVGEWSCGIRIGQPFERMQPNYVLKICLRVLVILATGIFTLPLLSLIFKKDLAGQLTKASLYTLK